MRDATISIITTLLDIGISIHASHAGRDVKKCRGYYEMPFQSTRPMRDATGKALVEVDKIINFNPRVPCGTRRRIQFIKKIRDSISIHASHAGRDSDIHKSKSLFKTFLVLSQHNFTLLVANTDFTTNKTMFILCELGVIIKTASSSH